MQGRRGSGRHPSEDELLRGEEASTQFEREPREPEGLHRPLPKGLNFGGIFCLKTVRTILDGGIIRQPRTGSR